MVAVEPYLFHLVLVSAFRTPFFEPSRAGAFEIPTARAVPYHRFEVNARGMTVALGNITSDIVEARKTLSSLLKRNYYEASLVARDASTSGTAGFCFWHCSEFEIAGARREILSRKRRTKTPKAI
ncbi:hypothetical protein HZH68_003313 [Vespula germanica]|uniref:Uncharacterized protein n=1 Tax=Vespula germanica TaxID=30212 RepID=A0A834U319_VESGE|nr:hypothetical protein HZH68_003313 [Vespula germanica]